MDEEKTNFNREIVKEASQVPARIDELEERKKKIIGFLKKEYIWVIGILIVALVLGIYIRSLPMQDHGGGTPGLWDITTNTWTLGPDLDPWLFLRTAKSAISNGSIPKIDTMRNVPLGFDNTKETMLLPYMIISTYYFLHFFDNNVNIEFAAVILPIIMFALTIISFFLFVREIFIRKSKKSRRKANIISLISTFFMIVMPIFLSRTIAGIPEKESVAFFFMFLSFYLFLKAWKSEKLKNSIIFGISAGISTILMELVWGGVIFVYVTIALSSLIAFILNKIHKKEFISYSLWILLPIIFTPLVSGRTSLLEMISSLDSGLAFLVFLIFLIHFILWYTKFSQNKILSNIKLPKSITSIIVALVFMTFFLSIFIGHSFIIEKIKAIHQTIFKPIVGRWSTTVAENRQPYFNEWASSFGPFIKNIPLMLWLFILGSVVLFKKMLNKIKPKDSWILTGLYILLLFGMIFSRYSSSSIFNGENLISKIFYYGVVLLFLWGLIRIYLEYHKKNDKSFEKVRFEYLFLLILLLISIFSARGAVRLIMMLGPIAPIFLAYLIYESINQFKKTKDETIKIFLGLAVILILVLSIFIFWSYFNEIKIQAHNYIPSLYNLQWQKAMKWVRDETPVNAVFGHWWDYGYWVQSIGNRATVLDGGNAITFWNYYMGRLVLTGDNQKDALEFLYSHNTTHLLIDSSDIGKYGAFSSIGSDKNYDRYSWIGTFLLDEKQTVENRNQTSYLYTGGVSLDEDLIINENEKEILLPKQSAGIGAVILPLEKINDKTKFSQPYVIAVYQGKQYKINLKYLSIGGEFINFDSGIEATVYIFPRLDQENQRIKSNPIGAAIYLSPKLLRGMLAQKYILNDPFNKFPNFKLVHTEQSLVVENLNSQGMNLSEFIYYQGIQGPIKIWEIKYTGKEENKPEYLDTDASKYLSWEL